MKYKYIDSNGNVLSNLSDNNLKNELAKSYHNWLLGSGDAAIESSNIDLLIIKVVEGIFIMLLSDYSSPLINSDETKVITHYVGGEPMDIPSNCICDEETAFKIIKYFIENNGKLSPDYQWVDIFNYVPNRYE